MFLKFSVPFSIILAGPSGCGKSTFAHRFLENLNELTDTHFKTIFWCFSEHGSVGDVPKIPGLKICQGIPEKIGPNDKSPKLIVIDDFMNDKKYESRICDLFIKGSHHRNISIIFICQNIFYQSKFSRTISLNAKYLVIFKNVRDQYQFFPLARQLHPENPAHLLKVYKDCTKEPYGYLMIDLNQETLDIFRFRTNIFNTNYCVCFSGEEELSKYEVEKNEQEEHQKSFKTFGGQQVYFIHT